MSWKKYFHELYWLDLRWKINLFFKNIKLAYQFFKHSTGTYPTDILIQLKISLEHLEKTARGDSEFFWLTVKDEIAESIEILERLIEDNYFYEAGGFPREPNFRFVPTDDTKQLFTQESDLSEHEEELVEDRYLLAEHAKKKDLEKVLEIINNHLYLWTTYI